jgi:hypothetical protein
MSHVATLKVKVNDIDALKVAVDKLGLEWREGQKTYKWYGTWVNDYHGGDAAYKHGIDPKNYGKCDHAIGVPGKPGAYEVGVVKMEDGSYSLIYDFWGGGHGLMEKISHEGRGGKDCGKLIQTYAREAAVKEAEAQGFFVEEEETDEEGDINLYLTM